MSIENRGFDPSKENEPKSAEDQFFDLVDSLDEVTASTRKLKEIEDLADKTEDYATALSSLKDFIQRRRDAMNEVRINKSETGEKLDKRGIEDLLAEIRTTMSNPERFLGNGATADVFSLRTSSQDLDTMICTKVITDKERYTENLTLAKEMRVMDKLRNLQVEGVRSPAPLFTFSNLRHTGLVMEQLDAVNFRRVIEGQTTEGVKDELPANFNNEDYFKRLRAFIDQMHKEGVVHGDLHLRNLMVDRETGFPRVIDFGKAQLDVDLDKTRTSMQDELRIDIATTQAAEIEARKWIEAQALTNNAK